MDDYGLDSDEEIAGAIREWVPRGAELVDRLAERGALPIPVHSEYPFK